MVLQYRLLPPVSTKADVLLFFDSGHLDFTLIEKADERESPNFDQLISYPHNSMSFLRDNLMTAGASYGEQPG